MNTPSLGQQQCCSCGGFCRRGKCERADVPQEKLEQRIKHLEQQLAAERERAYFAEKAWQEEMHKRNCRT